MFWLPIILGASALGSYLSNTKGARTGTQSGSSTQSGTSTTTGETGTTSTETPLISPQSQQILNYLMGDISKLDKFDLSGYAASGIGNINRTSDLRQRAISNLLASRGMSFSPAASVATTSGEMSRLSDIGSLLNSLPLLRRQVGQENINSLTNVLRSIPFGVTRTGRTTTTGSSAFSQQGSSQGTYTNPGSAIGAGLGDAGQWLAYLYSLGKLPGMGG